MSLNLRILGVLSRAYQPNQVVRRQVSGRRLLFLTCSEGYPCVVMIGIRELNGQIDGNVFTRGHRTDAKGLTVVVWNNMNHRSFRIESLVSDLAELLTDHN